METLKKRILAMIIVFTVTVMMIPSVTFVTFADDTDEVSAAGSDISVTETSAEPEEDEDNGIPDGYFNTGSSLIPDIYGNKTKKLTITEENKDDCVSCEVYILKDGEKVVLESGASVKEGTAVYVKAVPSLDVEIVDDHAISDISVNEESVFDEEHYDTAEQAYCFKMPSARTSALNIVYDEAVMERIGRSILQLEAGSTLDIADCAELFYGSDAVSSDRMRWRVLWEIDGGTEKDVVEFADESQKVLTAVAEGEALVWACADGNSNVGLLFDIEVYADRDDMAKVSFNDSGDISILVIDGETDEFLKEVPYSGYLVPKGTKLVVDPVMTDSTVLSSVTCNGKLVKAGASIAVKGDCKIKYETRAASVKGVPEDIELKNTGDTYSLKAKVSYDSPYSGKTVYDPSITYESSDTDLVTVSDKGVITVTGNIPEEGTVVIVRATAGSSNNRVYAECKVALGNYNGNRKVGTLTIAAYPGSKVRLMPHGFLTLTTYEDMKMPVSYYAYYKTNSRYMDLMKAYADDPESFSSDPALYNDDLNIPDRESYFDCIKRGAHSRPVPVRLKAGESITIGNSTGNNASAIENAILTLEDSSIKDSRQTAELIKQLQYYSEDSDQFDLGKAAGGFIVTLIEAYKETLETGHNPVDGVIEEAGLFVNKELYTQFTSEVLRLPNNYYTVEITADELERLKLYVSDPDNNYFGFLDRNCTAAATMIWNSALEDRPELNLKANYTGFFVEPESLYIELGLLANKHYLYGHGGKNFTPRTPVYKKTADEGTEVSQDTQAENPAQQVPKTETAAPAAASENVTSAVPSLRSVKGKAAKKGFTVKWKKLQKKQKSGVSGIEVQYSTDPSFAGAASRSVSAGKSSLKVKGLSKGSVYYVRVRTRGSGNNVSAWSAAKRVKVR